MKKIRFLTILTIIALLLVSCGNNDTAETTSASDASSINTTSAQSDIISSEETTALSDTSESTAVSYISRNDALTQNTEDFISYDDKEISLTLDIDALVAAAAQTRYEKLREKHTGKNRPYTTKSSGQTVKNGDMVIITSVGECNGKRIDNAAGRQLVIGSGIMVPGYEEAIIGTPVTETTVFEIIFPKDYHPDYANQKATFTVTVTAIYRTYPDDYCDEYIYLATDFANVAEFEAAIKNEIIESKREEINNEILAQITANASFLSNISVSDADKDEFLQIFAIRYIGENKYNMTLEDAASFDEYKIEVLGKISGEIL